MPTAVDSGLLRLTAPVGSHTVDAIWANRHLTMTSISAPPSTTGAARCRSCMCDITDTLSTEVPKSKSLVR